MMNNKVKMIVACLSLYGMHELINGQLNPDVEYMLENVTDKDYEKNTAWCAAFVGSALKDNGFTYSKKLNAQSYMKVGRKTEHPQLGDMVVFWREAKTSWKGHVGFWIGENESVVWVLGGNQNNKVCIKAYSKKQLLGYRRPVKMSPMAVKKSDEMAVKN